MAVQAGINNVNRELSEVYAGVSGVNRKLDKWQCCIGNVNRDLLEPGYIYTMSVSEKYGTWLGAADGGEFTPATSWNETFTGMEVSGLPSANIVGVNMYLTFSDNLIGKSILMTVELMGAADGSTYISLGESELTSLTIPSGSYSGTAPAFQLPSTTKQALSISMEYSNVTKVIVGFYVDSTPVKLI